MSGTRAIAWTRVRAPLALAGAFSVVLIALPIRAHANHSQTTLASGSGPNCCPRMYFDGASDDGKRVFFETDDVLDPADTNGTRDIYMRDGGTLTLVTRRPGGATCSNPSQCMAFVDDTRGRKGAVSADGRCIAFVTDDRLVSADTDSYGDVYQWCDGTISLISTSAPGVPEVPSPAGFVAASADGRHVFFYSKGRLTSDDNDVCGSTGCGDIYENDAGTIRLVTTGPAAGLGSYEYNPNFGMDLVAISADGSRAYFESPERLTADDMDTGAQDVYERSGGTTTLISTGPSGSDWEATFSGLVQGGVLFSTYESLVPEDTDEDLCVDPEYGSYACPDTYERSGSTTTLVTTSATGAGCQDPAGCYSGAYPVAEDSTKLLINTEERWSNADTNNLRDVYLKSGDDVTLVSAKNDGSVGDQDAFIRGVSQDGSHVVFQTRAALVSGDTDGSDDLYERFNGTTTLVSTGPADANICCNTHGFVAISKDGTRVFFETDARLVSADKHGIDIYERFAGRTTLISTGPADSTVGPLSATLQKVADDGKKVFFTTDAKLVPGDNDTTVDVYSREVAYDVPLEASSLQASLVPVFKQCGTGGNPATAAHAPPLAVGSCAPSPSSAVARVGSTSQGSVQLNVSPGDGDPGNGDQADVAIVASLSDVQTPLGADYAPNPSGADATLVYRLRNTDLDNCTGCSTPYESPGTATDLDFSVPVNCVPSPGPEGSTCSVNTTADAVLPNMVHENKQTIAQVFRLRLNDAGENGVPGDSDDKLFAHGGVFVP